MADFEEVWTMMKPNSNPKTQKNLSITTTSSSSAWRITTASRSIPRAATSSATRHSSSVPLSIPDWSKILNKNPRNDDGDGDGDGEEMVPPHEYLARRLAATQIASFSMCEGGVGRTLKGRDLANLRKAILTKTGFLE